MNTLHALLGDITDIDWGEATTVAEALAQLPVDDDDRAVAKRLARAGFGPGDVNAIVDLGGPALTLAVRSGEPIRTPFPTTDGAQVAAIALRLLLVEHETAAGVTA